MTTDLQYWQAAQDSGDPFRMAAAARALADEKSKVDTAFRFTVCDNLWTPVGEIGADLMEGSGTDPRNNVPTGRLVIKGDSPLIEQFMACRTTMVGVLVETAGLTYPFYVKTHTHKYENSAWTSEVELKGIWDILSYLVIWPSWYLPIQAQPFSHAVFMWALCTVLENMVAECAIRIQAGINEFLNNAGSLNPDMRAWFGTVLSAIKRGGIGPQSFRAMLRTPIYVKRHNPLLDTSPLVCRTVRMESCAAVIKDITRAYGVDVAMDLWRPGDPQPDPWSNLTQPAYIFSTKDRSQVTGPTKTVLDSAIRTVVDLEGSLLGKALDPLLNPQGRYAPEGVYIAPSLGVNFEQPYAILIAPDPGEDSAIISCEISDHTPDGWQHIVGGRSPKWVGAPPGNWGGTGPRANLLTK